MTSLAPLLQAFFMQRLINERKASPNTVAAYRDTFRLLLGFVKERLEKTPAQLRLADLDAPLIADFLDHLERERHNCVRTRNARLAAIHSFFHFAAYREPDHCALIQRVLAIPAKRYDRNLISFLNLEEIEALLDAPDPDTWIGHRDAALLLIAIQTGLRVSELTSLTWGQIALDSAGPHVRCCGKGRKERSTPLTREAVRVLRAWQRRRTGSASTDPVFPSRRGTALSRDAIERLVKKYVAAAQKTAPSLQEKRISPHVLRHTTAVQLLRAGVDCSVIALWLGHESSETTQIYLHADLSIKEKAMAKTDRPNVPFARYRPDDQLLTFLKEL